MKIQEVLAKNQTNMATTQKDLCNYLKNLTDKMSEKTQDGSEKGKAKETSPAAGPEISPIHVMDDDEFRKDTDNPPANESAGFITREDLERFLEDRGKDKTSTVHRHQPPYPTATQRIPLPKGYTSPTFILYNGT